MKNQKKFYARIASITFENFRNIEYGEVKFPNGKVDDFYNGESSVLGIYGQNGSGKTSVVMAINVLKSALLGFEIFHEGLIKKDCETSKLVFGFSIYDSDENKYNAKYSFELFNAPDQDEDIDVELESQHQTNKPKVTIGIKNETIEYDGISSDGNKIRHKVLLSTLEEFCANGTKAFGTKPNTTQDTEYNSLTNNDNMTIAMLLNRKKDTLEQKKSFLFYKDVHELISSNMKNEHDNNVYMCLAIFGAFIITSGMGEAGIVNFGDLPLNIFDYSESNGNIFQFRHAIKLDKEIKLIDTTAEKFEHQFNKINSVISKLIPGINIYLKCKETVPFEKDPQRTVKKFELFSERNGVEMPLRYESSGIRRLISFMSVLITAYNFPSITFAIDEFDSGIFEDLLGRLISIFAETGKGQLIFTSHNLRPLEVLESDNIIFTTVNCKNKFLKLSKRGNSNLRDMFLRAIKLGGTTEKLYNYPDEYEMELALALAARGETNGQ